MPIVLIPHKTPRADLNKGDGATVVGVHVGMYFEHKTAKCRLKRRYDSFFGKNFARTGCYFDKTTKQFVYAEVIQRRTEKDGSLQSLSVCIQIGIGVNFGNQSALFAQLICLSLTQILR